MRKGIDLANRRDNAASCLEAAGQKTHKEYLLKNVIPTRLARNHEECRCHIHDLEFYDFTYNCLGVHVADLVRLGAPHAGRALSFAQMVRALQRGIVVLTNNQSGGIGLMNFDAEAAEYLGDETDEEVCAALSELYEDLNVASRRGCERPYVTLNIGLATTESGRRVASAVLQAFERGYGDGMPFLFPNIVFKLSRVANLATDAPNHDLYEQALSVTAKRMIPTYFNCDQSANRDLPATEIGVMGCRSRLAGNRNGKAGAFNRGNVACVTLNLVQMAYQARGNMAEFYYLLDQQMKDAEALLMHRFATLCSHPERLAGCLAGSYYMGSETGDVKTMLANGTFSIGFIGIWDALGVLYGEPDMDGAWLKEHFHEAYLLVKHMREFTDAASERQGFNFSLLASAAEGVTGRMAMYDAEHLGKGHATSEKGFYTNSFHVPVTVPVGYREKTALEGPFHKLCNGGSITYVEFREMPSRNVQAVREVVENAVAEDCSYIGINFPLDACNDCGYTGRMNEECPICNGHHIKRLRRVSGYLAEESTFAAGKQKEMAHRLSHI